MAVAGPVPFSVIADPLVEVEPPICAEITFLGVVLQTRRLELQQPRHRPLLLVESPDLDLGAVLFGEPRGGLGLRLLLPRRPLLGGGFNRVRARNRDRVRYRSFVGVRTE